MLHLSPRDLDQLTVAEYDQLAVDLDAYLAEMQRIARDADRASKGR